MGRASQRRQKIPLVERGVHFSRRMKRILASGARHHRRVARRDPITAFPRSNREAFARTLRGEPSARAAAARKKRERRPGESGWERVSRLFISSRVGG
jgi:hypothetical protein